FGETSGAWNERLGPLKLLPGQTSQALSCPQRSDRGDGVRLLSVRITDYEDSTAALRGLVLVGTFDDASTPQIWCPVGDFFGSGPVANRARSMLRCIISYSQWKVHVI